MGQSGYGMGQNPAIHFAPVIKITGQNDFSTEPSNMADSLQGQGLGLGLGQGPIQAPDIKIKESGEPTIDKIPDKMDFSKLIIKKST